MWHIYKTKGADQSVCTYWERQWSLMDGSVSQSELGIQSCHEMKNE